MLTVGEQFVPRAIFYKHQDANLFPAWTYVLGRSLSTIPMALLDGLVFGSIIFWYSGLAYNDGASVANYFIFILLLFCISLSAGLLFSVFSSAVRDRTLAQAAMAVSSK